MMTNERALTELHATRPSYWFESNAVERIIPLTTVSARIHVRNRETGERFTVGVYAQ